jgi:Ser/Thr protein kinase RdoA (MazF antagonist)
MDAAPLDLTRLFSHGMDCDTVVADWPAITMEEVQQVLGHYAQTGSPEQLIWHSPRPFTAACVVLTSVGQVFIKRHHHVVRTAQQLEEEHQFIRHLDQQGVAVSVPLKQPDGSSAIDLAPWSYEVYWRAAGCDIYRDAMSWTPFQSTQHAYHAGHALATMHRAAESYAALPRTTPTLISGFKLFNTAHPIDAIAQCIAQDAPTSAYLAQHDWQTEVREVLFPFYEALVPHLATFTPLWTHNDWHASNLLWTDNSRMASVATIIDFGLCNRTSALFDLATAIERNIVEWLALGTDQPVKVHLDHLDALLDGYTHATPLTQTQWEALAALLPLVHSDFALSELAYFTGITHASHHADLAYHGYFIGHAKWFSTADGQALLAHIRQRALR